MSFFYKPTPYNDVTKNQMWMSMISDGHDMHCGCHQPFAHLLDSIFPKGHSDRNKTIEEIIERDFAIRCLSTGEEENEPGTHTGVLAIKQGTEPGEGEEDYIKDKDLEDPYRRRRRRRR